MPRTKTKTEPKPSRSQKTGAESRWALGAVPEMEGLSWHTSRSHSRGCCLPPWCDPTKHAERQFEQFHVVLDSCPALASSASPGINEASTQCRLGLLNSLRAWVNLHRGLLERGPTWWAACILMSKLDTHDLQNRADSLYNRQLVGISRALQVGGMSGTSPCVTNEPAWRCFLATPFHIHLGIHTWKRRIQALSILHSSSPLSQPQAAQRPTQQLGTSTKFASDPQK